MNPLVGFLIVIAGFGPLGAHAQTLEGGLRLGAAVDLVGLGGFDDSSDNRLRPRAVELILLGPIDQTFDAVVNVAGHEDDGEFGFRLHEGFVASSRLIPDSRFRLGRFLLNFGRLNAFHQHDWPFITAPKSHREFLVPGSDSAVQAESAIDTGGEFTWNLPTERFWDITLGVTNGYCFGHCHGDTDKPPYPMHYLRLTTFLDHGQGSGVLLGSSYLGRETAAHDRAELWGIEATAKVREGRVLRWLSQTELMFETQDRRGGPWQRRTGGYTFVQYGLDELWSLGFRADAFSDLDLRFGTGERQRNLDYGAVGIVTYANSEFSRWRLAYSHEIGTRQGESERRDRQVQFQFVYILGAHPAHDF